MFHITTCPACQTRFSIPEKNVGTRQVCPHCQSPFVAGKSVSEGPGPMSGEAASAYTMLGEAEGNIRYNCPRCKKQLEAPAREAGMKKPCPGCGQRVQVPALAPAPAADPALNKTLLGEENTPEPMISYNCPKCKKPLEAPASEAGKKKPCPACGQRLQIPERSAAGVDPSLNKTLLAEESSAVASGASTDAPAGPAVEPATSSGLFSRRAYIIGGGVAAAVLLFALGMVITAPGANAAREQYEQAMRDFEAQKLEIEKQKQLLEQQRQLLLEQAQAESASNKAEMELLRKQQAEREANFARMLKEDQDEKKAAALKAEHDAEMRKLAESRESMERQFRQQAEQHQAQLDLIRNQLKQANDKQTTIIQQPIGMPFYHRWHPFYGWH